jgi:hypothetical protein
MEKKIMLIIFCILFCCSCRHKKDIKYIKAHLWAYDRGFQTTNNRGFLDFRKGAGYCWIKHDTIYSAGTARAIIIKLDRKKDELHIKMLPYDSVTIYTNADAME